MNTTRAVCLTLLILCIMGGLVAALFSPTLAATLTLSSSATPTTVSQVAALPTVQPTPPPAEPTDTAQPTPLPSGVAVLVQDTFQRPDQALWGQSSDGQIWSGDANRNPLFSIVNGTGQIIGGKSYFRPLPVQAIMNVTNQDSELLVSGTISQFNARGTINWGAVLRWQDAQNWYQVQIDGTHLQLLKSVQGTVSVIQSLPFKAVSGTAYSIRFRILGSYLFVKAWPSAQPEPTNWTFLAIDTSLRTGSSGIRVTLMPHTFARFNSLIETTVPTVE